VQGGKRDPRQEEAGRGVHLAHASLLIP
jgi:hypothetical protein